MSARYKYVEDLASNILRDSHIVAPQVDILSIIKKLGIEINERSMESISGAAVISGLSKTILLNRNENSNPNRARFTLAHELGHILLHSGNALNVDANPVVHFRMVGKSTGSDVREVEANYFAASILMPKVMIHEAFHAMRIESSISDENISELAMTFGVSSTAMCIRLGSIGIS